MREIKFRAWKKSDTPEMFTDVNVIDFKKNIIGLDFPVSTQTVRPDVESLDNVVLMQYTGLFDANLKEIYEGDIVATKRAGLIGTRLYITEARGEVMFGDCNFYIEQTDGIDPLENYSVGFENVVTEIEVIGNIYENPELLED